MIDRGLAALFHGVTSHPMNTNPKHPAPPPSGIASMVLANPRSYAQNSAIPAHARLSGLMEAFNLNDDTAAALLDVARPVVNRTRTGSRPASFEVAVRVEALLGIPASHWREVPDAVKEAAKTLKAAKKGKAK